MEKCHKKNQLYNAITKRCYKSCEQKDKVTHPVTKKCRKRCKSEKIRRAEDFRCVKKTLKIYKPKPPKKIYQKRLLKQKAPEPKAKAPEPKEELVPLQLQKEIQKNFQFLDEWIQKGKGKTIKYDGDMVSEFITVYFHEKYKQHCPMYPIKTYNPFDLEENKILYEKHKKNYTTAQFKEYLLTDYKYEYIEWNKDKFLKNLKLCLETGEQLIMVPFRLPRHLNMLIIKAPTREIIRFEPHGSQNTNETKEKEANTFLEKLTADINTYLTLTDNRKFTYVTPSKLCPNYNANLSQYIIPGFQTMENIRKAHVSEGGGFCQLWSWFFAECVIQNPEMDIKEVYKEAFNVLKTNENNFATIIRGYFFSINDQLKKMKKTYTITSRKEAKRDKIYILLDYLKQNQKHLQNKPRKKFIGGIKKHNFILPEANPKANPVHF